MSLHHANGFRPEYVESVARRFLRELDPGATAFTFQAFHDVKRGVPSNGSLARVINLAGVDNPELLHLYKQGSGVWVCANEMDGRGRQRENISRIRAVWCEHDGGEPPDFPIEPSMVVETSPGHHHYYFLVAGPWTVDDRGLADHAAVLDRMVASYGSDNGAKGANRVLRVPGFLHRKDPNNPFMVRIASMSGRRYTRAEILAAFPPVVQERPRTQPRTYSEDVERIRSALRFVPAHDRQTWLEIGMGLKAELGESGRDLWDEWSESCPEKFDSRAQDTVWRSLRGTGITIATLFHHARQAGWRDHSFNGGTRGTNSGRADMAGEAAEAAAKSAPWPEPTPIQAKLHPVSPFDANTMLPPVLREWVLDEADRMPCPPDFVAAAAISTLGAVIGARCAIRPKQKDDWLVVANLWGGIVADPSAKKTPAIAAGQKPLDRLVAKALENQKLALADHEAAMVAHEAREEAIKARIKKAAADPKHGNVEAIVRELRTHQNNEPPAPVARRYKTNDCTVEKVGEILRDNPAGILVYRDELVGLLASWEREGREGERTFYLEGWNGIHAFDTDRIGRGTILIPNLCLTVFGGIQPDKLTVYLDQAANALGNDGLLQRFQLLVYPDPRLWEWRDREPNTTARNRVHGIFSDLSTFDPVQWGAAPADEHVKFPCFRFSAEAQEVFISWSKDLHVNRLKKEDHPIIAQHLSKYDKLFPALSLILHLVEFASSAENLSGGEITKTAAVRAAAWCEYLESHARRCYGLLLDDGLRHAQALARKIQQGKLCDGFTARDVRRQRWLYLSTDEAVEAAIDWLKGAGWLRDWEVGGTGPGSGHPTIRYAINPKVRREGKVEGGQDAELA